jgi:lysophospholipase
VGEKMEVHSNKGFIESVKGIKLYFERDLVEHPRVVVLILHGICEHLGRYVYLKNQFNTMSFNVYRFDFRGHGYSEGRKAHIDDYNEYIDDVDVMLKKVKVENPNVPVIILGHSFGGFIAVAYGIINQNRAEGYIISAPTTSDEAGILDTFKSNMAIDTYVQNNLSKIVCSDAQVRKEYVEDPLVHDKMSIGLVKEMLKGIAWMKRSIEKFNDPILLIHGEEDQIVSYIDSEDLYEKMSSKDKNIIIYPGLWHEILNEKMKDQVILDVITWIHNRF